VALVSFNAAATIHQPLTSDITALDAALRRLESAPLTRIDTGLTAAASVLAAPERRLSNSAVVVLLSDGHNNPEPVDAALAAAAGLRTAGARVITVGLGDAVDVPALETMASALSDYHHAPDGDDLPALYESLARLIPCPPSVYWPFDRR
jgi:Mg-chelatase subunit ChlD